MNDKKDPEQIERQLIPRLKVMSYILFTFALITLAYRFTLPTPEEPSYELFSEKEVSAGFSFSEDNDQELLPSNPSTYYIFSALFASMGLLSLYAARRKAANLATDETVK